MARRQDGPSEALDDPRLFEELNSRGYSEDDLRRIGADNVLRALRDMESVAAR